MVDFSVSVPPSSICIAIVYYFMEVVKIWKTKLQLICEIMNAHATYLSSQTSSWNFYICVFLTLRLIWLFCSFYITCNNIMCFIIFTYGLRTGAIFLLAYKTLCDRIKYISILLFYYEQITFIVCSNCRHSDAQSF